jgi:CubicO group peptidase (beta-lactamase class C family)
VTLRRLLSHTAGLTVHGFPGYATDEAIPSLRAVLNGKKPANTVAIRVDKVPGSGWRYSGGGYCVVQQLMIDITGKPFPSQLKETVLQPLGMNQSTYEQPLPATRRGVAATGHTADSRPVRGRWHVYPEMAAAGLWTTPSDLARFAIELAESHSGKSNRALSRRAAEQMVTPQMGDAGLGIFVNGSGQSLRFSHGGANEGFRAMMVVYAETGRGAVVMVNSDNGADLYNAILRSIAREYEWPDFQPKLRAVVSVDAAACASYVGRYQISPDMVLAITLEEGKLFAQATGQPKIQLHPDSKTRFFITEGEVEMTFLPGDRGKVDEVIVNMNRQEIKAKRLK